MLYVHDLAENTNKIINSMMGQERFTTKVILINLCKYNTIIMYKLSFCYDNFPIS